MRVIGIPWQEASCEDDSCARSKQWQVARAEQNDPISSDRSGSRPGVVANRCKGLDDIEACGAACLRILGFDQRGSWEHSASVPAGPRNEGVADGGTHRHVEAVVLVTCIGMLEATGPVGLAASQSRWFWSAPASYSRSASRCLIRCSPV